MGGLSHGLTALAASSPLVHVFDQPTLFNSALWLPYRKHKEEIAAALAAAGPVKAVFAHADVVRTFVLYCLVCGVHWSFFGGGLLPPPFCTCLSVVNFLRACKAMRL